MNHTLWVFQGSSDITIFVIRNLYAKTIFSPAHRIRVRIALANKVHYQHAQPFGIILHLRSPRCASDMSTVDTVLDTESESPTSPDLLQQIIPQIRKPRDN